MKKIVKLAGLLALLASSANAADMVAQTEPAVVANPGGFYLGSISSLTFPDNTSFSSGGASFDTDYDLGMYSGLRAGYSFGSYGFVSPRVELEVGYGTADVNEISIGGVNFGSNSFGEARTIQGFVNAYLDIPTNTAFTPYFGGGIGAMNLELHKQGVAGVAMDDDDTQFAYHLDAGVGIDLNTISFFRDSTLFSNTTFDIGYRYTAADDFNFTARDGSASSTDFSSHAVVVGFRRKF